MPILASEVGPTKVLLAEECDMRGEPTGNVLSADECACLGAQGDSYVERRVDMKPYNAVLRVARDCDDIRYYLVKVEGEFRAAY